MAKEPKEEREEEGQESEEKPKKSKKLIIIIAVIVLVLIVGGVGAFFALKAPKGGEGEGAAEAATQEEEAKTEEGAAEGHGEVEANLFPLETFIVNLQVKGSFLKVDIQLEFAAAEEMKSAEKEVPRLRDTIIQILSSKTASEILTSDGKEKLKDELRQSINGLLGEEKVVEVYFTEFIIQ